MASSIRLDTTDFDTSQISFLASDASETACGGGLLTHGSSGFSFDPQGQFFSPLHSDLIGASSGLREITAIYWMLLALRNRLPSRIVTFTDSSVACSTIARGSRIPGIQDVARRIFAWCMWNHVQLLPCWAPRDCRILAEADARSRWRDVHGQLTPTLVFAEASRVAVSIWGRTLSFDRQASHLNVIPPRSWHRPPLPFNSLCHQPGSAGVDIFLQPASSWQRHINFVHPASPTIGRLLTFLPSTASRTVVVIPTRIATGRPWWSNLVRRGAPGVVSVRRSHGFLVVAVDHRRRRL